MATFWGSGAALLLLLFNSYTRAPSILFHCYGRGHEVALIQSSFSLI